MIDLRSDTVTRPSGAMRQAMARAEVGDDVFRDDPTVLRLEAMVAERLGHEAGLFFPTGTQSNLAAIMAHCGRGDEYIVSATAHCYRYEAGGAAVLGSVQPQPLSTRADATMSLDDVRGAIKPDDDHFAKTRLVCLENTTGGVPLAVEYVADVQRIAREHSLGLHLDGARIFNAAAALETPAEELARGFDTVSVCLSKGLGAPAGTVLVGHRDHIVDAKRWRKMLGGAMRQSGLLAAAGIHALEHNVDRLADDHTNARRLAARLAAIDALQVDRDVPTNMFFVRLPDGVHTALEQYLRARDIVIYAPGDHVRLVTHRDVSAADVERTADAFEAFFA